MIDPLDLAARFPADFTFGVSTSAYQIEGATREDGRGPSIWDAFANMPGRVFEGHTGDAACDHYHRWESDLDLIYDLGMDAYRFSITWPRIFPEGRGKVNAAGLDFYDRLIDGLVSRGIKVFPTLYHWDLPLALTGYGGWTDRDTADAFAEYTSVVVRRFGDRMDALATFNEPWCSTYLSHWVGSHAPGERSIDAALAAVHVTNLAHGLGVQAARAERADLSIGIVFNAQCFYSASDSAGDKAATERAFQFNNGVFFGPIFDGAYDAEFTAALGDKLKIQDGDLATIKQPLDWWGLNYYSPVTVRHVDRTGGQNRTPCADGMGVFESGADAASQFLSVASIPTTENGAKTDNGWEIKPKGLADLLTQLYERYDLPPVYITENGACYNMGPGHAGTVNDQPRVDYFAEHLDVLAGALDEGIPVKGYFAWSLMDNFEWAEGYAMRFGIVHVDHTTQNRTIKKSGEWYRDLVRAHGSRDQVD
ncbi:family 1 glycosylhydrolase [Loktanella agnita]|uniref:family 1 glycosylhydrolase n=1 Tax=Loktanella agnita TaxID=287097 RepID=UPI0039897D65